jgi:hypothetical protein
MRKTSNCSFEHSDIREFSAIPNVRFDFSTSKGIKVCNGLIYASYSYCVILRIGMDSLRVISNPLHNWVFNRFNALFRLFQCCLFEILRLRWKYGHLPKFDIIFGFLVLATRKTLFVGKSGTVFVESWKYGNMDLIMRSSYF